MRQFTFSQSRFFVFPRSLKGFVFAVSVALGAVATVQAQVATTTQLTIPVSTVAVGVPVLLTATVTDAASHSVHLGTVTFYDGARSLGSAQLVNVSPGAYPVGTANLKTASLSAGANSITAVFAGTTSDLKSTSTAKTVTVTGKYATATVLSGYAVAPDFYLTAALRTFGSGTPTGSIDFVHETIGTIETKSLSGAKWKTFLDNSNTMAIGGSPAGGQYSVSGVMAAADFDGDGVPDLAMCVTTTAGKHQTNVLLGNGDGSFKAPIAYAGQAPMSVYAADFNNDGKLDLAVVNNLDEPNVNKTISIRLGNGDGTFQPSVSYGSDTRAKYAYIGDLNRDGSLDIVFFGANGLGHSTLDVLLGNGDGSFQAEQSYALNTSTPTGITGGDLNGDGVPDVVLFINNKISVLLGKGDGTFFPETDYPNGSQASALTLADMNGDGKLDLILEGRDAFGYPSFSLSLGKGDGSFATAQSYAIAGDFQAYPKNPVVADFNQDGKLDVAVEMSNINYGANESGSNIQLFLGNGDGTFQPIAIDYLTDIPADLPLEKGDNPGAISSGPMIAGDFNGDGRPDLLTTDPYDIAINTILNRQTTSLSIAQDGLGPRTTTVQAIYSGDGGFAGSTSNAVPLSQADVDFSGGFAGAGAELLLNDGASVVGSGLRMTSGGVNQATSAYAATPVNIQQFVTDFTLQMSTAEGLTFAIQNVGPTAVGSSGAGLGYQGIKKSFAVKFDTYNSCSKMNDSTGRYSDGASPLEPCVDLAQPRVNLGSGDPIQVHITYDGVNLEMTLTDTVSLASYGYLWPIDIPSKISGPTAYVGFTGSTGSVGSTATITGWKYTAGTPPPYFLNELLITPTANDFFEGGFLNTANLVLNGSALYQFFNGDGIAGTIASLTNGAPKQAGSVFYAAPQNVQAFTTEFSFEICCGTSADGLTFTMQNAGPQALGGTGGGLGYKHIGKSVAVKLDFFNNNGEGNSSTGLYIDGASPDVPAVDMAGSIDLLPADTPKFFKADLVYDGTTLTLTLSNFYKQTTFTHSWTIDIPAVVGGPTAYVGFTGATGGITSTNSLASWTYLPGVF